jgi:hypothetical protein
LGARLPGPVPNPLPGDRSSFKGEYDGVEKERRTLPARPTTPTTPGDAGTAGASDSGSTAGATDAAGAAGTGRADAGGADE